MEGSYRANVEGRVRWRGTTTKVHGAFPLRIERTTQRPRVSLAVTNPDTLSPGQTVSVRFRATHPNGLPVEGFKVNCRGPAHRPAPNPI